MHSLKFLLLLFFPIVLLGQNSDEINLKLAQEFYQEKEYEKSIDLYEDLFKKKPIKEIYLPLINAHIALKDYQNAEKIAGKQLRKYPNDAVYQVDMGYILVLQGEDKKGEKTFDNAIKKLPASNSAILDLSNSFQRRNQTTYAIECLKRGKKLTGDYYGYEFELGELYYQIGDIRSMINEYLDLLEVNEGYLQNIQNALNTSIYNDLNKENIAILNEELLKRVQKNSDRDIFAELLIWHYLQQKDFKGAIAQSKALDKKNHESGYRFLNLGNSCRSNRQYDLAMECYQYIIDKGRSSNNYISARILMTETIREKITSTPYTQQDILIMEQNYIQTLDDLGQNSATISLQIGLAEVWAFYLGKSDEGIEMLNQALSKSDIDALDAASCKLLLADIYLQTDDIWEASLLYSQVEKDFKYEELGDKAKFKNAQIYFYTGDFKWAKAQLDVLKGSTSKLISNDAMRLSLLISDNMAFDTSGQALIMFGRASLNFEQNQLESTRAILDTMKRIFIVHNIIDEVYYLEYQVYFKEQNYAACAKSLEKITSDYAEDILADEALFKLAEVNENYLENPEKAKEYYQKLFTQYPASIYVVEARNRFRQMRGDDLN